MHAGSDQQHACQDASDWHIGCIQEPLVLLGNAEASFCLHHAIADFVKVLHVQKLKFCCNECGFQPA